MGTVDEYICMYGCMNEWMYVCMYEWMDGGVMLCNDLCGHWVSVASRGPRIQQRHHLNTHMDSKEKRESEDSYNYTCECQARDVEDSDLSVRYMCVLCVCAWLCMRCLYIYIYAVSFVMCLALRLTSPVRSASVRREGTVWLGRSAKIDMASCTKACT